MDFWLNPGVNIQVNSLTKVTMVPAAPGETPPAGAMVVPPQSPLPAAAAMIRQAQEANLEVAREAAIANQAVLESQTIHPPWSVTFTEQK